MTNPLAVIQSNREKIRLVAYFVLLLVLAVPLSEMLAEGWNRADLARDLVRLRLFVGADHQAVSITVFGLYIGLLSLMTIDMKKRWQALLLWLATGVGLIALQSFGKFLPNVNLVGRFHLVLAGIVLGLLLGGGRKLIDFQNGMTLEFRRASKVLYLLFASFVVIGFLEYHVQYPNVINVFENGIQPVSDPTLAFGVDDQGILPNLVVSALFIATIRQFVKYDAEKNFFILGPKASGKSLFLIGSYLEALQRSRSDDSDTPLKPSEDLMSMMDALDRQESDWIVEATGRGELKYLNFQFIHGSVFPMNVQLSAMDYAGEYLTRLPDALTGAIEQDEMDNTLRRLMDGVQAADTLILVVDVERFENNEPLDISEYFSILQSTGDKGVILVATKADVIAEDFKDERGIDPHLHFEEFKQYVNTRLRQSENIDSLVTETAGSDIHPVYYQTKINENGNRVPMRDDSGSVMTVGYSELLDIVGRM